MKEWPTFLTTVPPVVLKNALHMHILNITHSNIIAINVVIYSGWLLSTLYYTFTFSFAGFSALSAH